MTSIITDGVRLFYSLAFCKTLLFYGGFAIIFNIYIKNHGKQATDYLKPVYSRPSLPIYYAAALLVLCCAGLILRMLPQAAGGPSLPGGAVIEPAGAVFIFFTSVIIPAIIEETVFRGVVLSELVPLGTLPACLLSSLFFALLHGSLPQVLYAFAGGLLLSAFRVCFSFRSAVILHFLNNCIAFIFLFTGKYSLILPLLLLIPGIFGIITVLRRVKLRGHRLKLRACAAALFPLGYVYILLMLYFILF